MNKELEEKLRQKGWSDEELKELNKIYSEKPNNDSYYILKKVVYWLSLFTGMVGNLTFSAVAVFFILFFSAWLSYVVLIIFGLLFGYIYLILVRGIEQIDPEHKIVMNIFIPAMALINVFILLMVTVKLNPHVNLFSLRGPLIMSLIYAYSFATPYFVFTFRQYLSRKNQNAN